MVLIEEIKAIQKDVDYKKLLVVIMLRMTLVILKHSMTYLKAFFFKK